MSSACDWLREEYLAQGLDGLRNILGPLVHFAELDCDGAKDLGVDRLLLLIQGEGSGLAVERSRGVLFPKMHVRQLEQNRCSSFRVSLGLSLRQLPDLHDRQGSLQWRDSGWHRRTVSC